VDSPLQIMAWVSLVAVLSYLAAKLGGTVEMRPEVDWPLWPGNVLLVSILLLVPRRIWPVLMATAFAAFALYDLQSGVALRSIALLILSDFIEVLTAAWGLSYVFGKLPRIDSMRALAKYAFIAIVFAPFIAAFVGALASSGDYWTSWRISFFSEALAFLTLLPAILGWASKGTWWTRESLAYHLEAGALLVGLVLLGYLTLVSSWANVSPALPVVPLLLWAALRFGTTGVSTAMVVLAFLSIWGTINGRGPFIEMGALKSVMSLQVFLLFSAAPFMVLAALVEERKRAEEARSRLASIAESSDDAIISKTLDGIIVTWNQGAQRIFGFSEAEAVGQSITMLTPPDLLGEEKAIMQKVGIGEKVEHLETVRVTKEGRKIDVSLTLSPLRDARGVIVGISKIARDITERKRTEEELTKSEERFSKAFRRSPTALSLTNARTHRYIDVNETFERITGYTRADVIGKSDSELALWVNPAERARLTQQLLLERFLRDVECECRAKGGRTFTALASAELIEIDGESCVLAVLADITDRKQAEHALQQSERRFRLVANTAPVMIWTSGLDKLCDYFNQPWLEFTGRPLAAELGNGWGEGVHAEDLTACLDTYTKEFDAHQSFKMQYRLRRHDGEYRWVLDTGVPRFNGDGSFAGYIGSCIDITDRKVAEETLSTVGRRLIEGQEIERTRIARELHDDINQRLALLANRVQGCEQAAPANKFPSQNKELWEIWRLTNEIATDIQHISHQLHPSKLHYLGLAAAVRDLCHEFSAQHKIEINCEVHNLPPQLEDSASLSLFRTVQESLHNVVKHSHARHVKVELIRQSNLIQLLVSDDGIGFNLEQARQNRGLGLVSMRERLRSVGGEFSICSTPSLGTQVKGIVPVTTKPVRREAAAD